MFEKPKDIQPAEHADDRTPVAEAVLSRAEPLVDRSVEALRKCAEIEKQGGAKKAKAEALGKRVAAAAKKMLFRLGVIAALGGAGMKTQERLTDFKVTEAEVVDGAKEYQHEDQETTHIINVLAGREGFSKSEKSFIAAEDTVIDRRVYDALWSLEKECGNPKIRWMHEKTKDPVKSRSYYNAISHTIHLKPDSLLLNLQEGFISELPHAKQYSQATWSSENVMEYLASSYRTWKESIEKGISRDKAFLKEYEVPGSNEYIAHKLMEPEMYEKYKLHKLLNDQQGQEIKRKVKKSKR